MGVYTISQLNYICNGLHANWIKLEILSKFVAVCNHQNLCSHSNKSCDISCQNFQKHESAKRSNYLHIYKVVKCFSLATHLNFGNENIITLSLWEVYREVLLLHCFSLNWRTFYLIVLLRKHKLTLKMMWNFWEKPPRFMHRNW